MQSIKAEKCLGQTQSQSKLAMFSLSNVPLNLIGGDVTILQHNKTAERG